MDITTIDEAELIHDLTESIEDVKNCQHALMLGVTQYSGGSVQHRLEVNQAIILKIKAELARRWHQAA